MRKEKQMRTNGVMKILCAVAAVALLMGSYQAVYQHGRLKAARGEFDETAAKLEQAIDDNEMDLSTGTLQYDTYKSALNSAAQSLNDGEQIVHINVGFGCLDRGLKYINDTYGHLNGKPTIKAFADLLKEVFPESEGWTICHRGGSGFLVFAKGNFDEEKLLSYYKTLKARWHDTPYPVPNGKGTVEGMALLYLAVVGPECGRSFTQLRNELVYKKLALRDKTNCGYVIETARDHYISNVEFDEKEYMEE